MPEASAIVFVVGDSKSSPFNKAGTHDHQGRTCGCDRSAAGVDGGHPDNKIEVNRKWFSGLTLAQRRATLAHENAHQAHGIDCEDCADRHGGYLMRAWGYTNDAIRAAFDALVHGERTGAGERAVQGASAYDLHRTSMSVMSAGPRSMDNHLGADGIDLAAEVAKVKAAVAATPRPTPTKTIRGTPTSVAATSSRVASLTQTIAPLASTPPPPVAEAVAPVIPKGTPGPDRVSAVAVPVGSSQPIVPRPGGSFDPGGPGATFTPAIATDPSLVDDLAATLAGTKVNTSIVVSEVVAGVIVAFLVFVVFRFGGK